MIAVGFEFNDMLPEAAASYPSVQFLQVDSCPFDKMKRNIHCSVFREYEASYLTGAEAGWTTKAGKVGAISALDIPFLHRYTDGFIEGAKHVNPDVKISPTLWVGGNNPFSDPARGEERGAAMVAAASSPQARDRTAASSRQSRARPASTPSASTSTSARRPRVQ